MSIGAKERLVFGRWLVRKGRLESRVLEAALEIQNAEKSDTLRSSPRMLGQILLDDFQVFRSRTELNQALVEFEKVKTALEARKSKLNIHEAPPPAPDSKKDLPGQKTVQALQKQATDRSLFGQFLIEKRKINEVILERALEIQNIESKDALRQSHRLLGEILIDEFNVFSSRVELNRLLVEFNDFKLQLESQRTALMYITRKEK